MLSENGAPGSGSTEIATRLAPIILSGLGLPLTISPTLATDVPVNPAIEKNELRAWST